MTKCQVHELLSDEKVCRRVGTVDLSLAGVAKDRTEVGRKVYLLCEKHALGFMDRLASALEKIA